MSLSDHIAKEPRLRFQAGDIVFQRGDPGDCAYIVLDGTVRIQISESVGEAVEYGSMFGEMALIGGKTRGGTAIAATECELVAIDRTVFTELVRTMPDFALQVMHDLAQRLLRKDSERD